MSKTKVIMSCDDNPFYYEFWNTVSYVWKNVFDIDPILIYICDETNQGLQTTNREVIEIKKEDGVPLHLQAQLAKVYFAANYIEDVCIMSDIDIIPVDKKFFSKEEINKKVTENTFFHLNPTPREFGQFPMCYYAGFGSTFSKITDGLSWRGFLRKVIDCNFDASSLGYSLPPHLRGKNLWFSDELFLHKEVKDKKINMKLNTKIIQGHERLDRENLVSFKSNTINNFIDCHMPRPYSVYSRQIEYFTYMLENNE